jgi:two-component system, response regulator PdtaR
LKIKSNFVAPTSVLLSSGVEPTGKGTMKDAVTILVVEDEFLIRLDLVLGVEDAGYRVKQASSADEAIRVLESDPSIRVVITDINMPGTMDGIALAHCVRERWPPTVIVISSAYVPERLVDAPHGSMQLPKPYTRPMLQKLLGEVDLALGE